MNTMKTKSIQNLEEKIAGLDEDSLRRHILESAKSFKTSWIELGQALYTVWRDKLYKDWGYSTLEAFTGKEIGIRKQTAMKLLRSYYFMEKEEPDYLQKNYTESESPAALPTYESIDVLRQAKNKKILDNKDYENLKKQIFEKGRDAKEAKKDLTSLIRERKELDPEEAQEKRKTATVKRLLGTLKAIKQEAELLKLLSAPVLKDAAALIKKLEEELA